MGLIRFSIYSFKSLGLIKVRVLKLYTFMV
jgi:hypothetical protein